MLLFPLLMTVVRPQIGDAQLARVARRVRLHDFRRLLLHPLGRRSGVLSNTTRYLGLVALMIVVFCGLLFRYLDLRRERATS